MNDEQESKSADETTDVTTTTEEVKPVTDQADGHGTTEPEQAEAKEGAAV